MRKINVLQKVNVVSIQLVKEKSLAYGSIQISTPKDAAAIAESFLAGADREHAVVMCLDTKQNINAINTISVGTLNSSPIHPREVFKPAILANSNAIIIFHNHTSGIPTPSADDLGITKRLVVAGSILGVEVLDHLIIGDNGSYVSLKETGVIKQLNESSD